MADDPEHPPVPQVSVDQKTVEELGRLRTNMQDDMQASVEKVRGQLRLDLGPVMAAWEDAQRHMRSQLATAATEWAQTWPRINEEFKRSWQPIWDSLNQHLEAMPARLERVLIALGQAGWFLDPNLSLPELWTLEKALRASDTASVDHMLDAHFDERRDGIQQTLMGRHPNRANLLRSAFAAHDRDEYELSIPVLLAQSDGICQEFTTRQLFKNSNKKPELALHNFTESAAIQMAALQPLLSGKLPIAASAKDRVGARPLLNRHQVLHGESWDYGTKTNGLRAISFINYVSYVLKPVTTSEDP